MTKLALLIATYEGFYKPGTLPNRDRNPGDLRHSPHSQHPGDPNAIGVIDTEEHGWQDLERQLVIYSERIVSHDFATGAAVEPHLMTLRDSIYAWAPTFENNTAAYLAFVVAGFAGEVNAQTPLVTVLKIQA